MSGQQRIFLGHASEDKPRVQQLYHQLKSEGFSPWLDAVDLIPGQNWRDEIPKAIKEAGIFLACLSKSSVEKKSYVQREFRYALSAYADRPPGSIYLIPVRLDDCEVPDLRLAEIELNLRDLHWVDLFEPDGLTKLVEAIAHARETTPPAQNEKTPSPNEPTASPSIQKPVEPSVSEPGTTNRQRNPTIVAAWIGAGALLLSGTLASPWLVEVFKLSVETDGPIEAVEPAIEPPAVVGSEPSTAHQPFENFRSCDRDLCPEMVMLPAGTFLMGSPETEEGRDDDEVQHEVTISQPFAIGKYEVTFDEYDRFASATKREKPGDEGWGRGKRPVIYVSWKDAQAYCAWLGDSYRLPTEAEWEYATRAGTTTRYSFGDDITKQQANFGSASDKTAEVGSYPANAWGLHDMHGNVFEWVYDWEANYSAAAMTDPQGPADGTRRVVRGGSWIYYAHGVRAAVRLADVPGRRRHSRGFRCAGVQES